MAHDHPQLKWQGDEPYLALPNGFRVTPYRPNSEEDITACIELSNDPSIAKYSHMRPYPYHRSDAETWFASHTTSDEEITAIRGGKPLRIIPFQVIREGNGPLIGDVGLIWEEKGGESGRWTIGYNLAPKYVGRGIGTAAVTAVIDWARLYWPGEVVHAMIEPRNTPSSSLARRVGFKHIRTRTIAWTRGEADREVSDWELVL